MSRAFTGLMVNTIQKEMRSKTFYIVLFFTAVLIFLVNIFVKFIYTQFTDPNASQFIGDQTANIVFLVIGFWSTLLSIVFGVNTVRGDTSSRVIGQLLSLPIKRQTYLFARIFGSSLLVLFYIITSIAFAMLLFSFSSGKLIGSVEIIYALAPMVLNIFLIVLLSVVFSFFVTNFMSLIGMSFLMSLSVLSNNILINQNSVELFSNVGVVKAFGLLLHFCLPRVGVIGSVIESILFGTELSFNLAMEGAHLIVVTGLWILAAIKLFERKNF